MWLDSEGMTINKSGDKNKKTPHQYWISSLEKITQERTGTINVHVAMFLDFYCQCV